VEAWRWAWFRLSCTATWAIDHVADAHHAVRLAFAPGFAAQAGSFTPHRTHHHRSTSLDQASVGSVGALPSLDMVAASTKTARARSARTSLPGASVQSERDHARHTPQFKVGRPHARGKSSHSCSHVEAAPGRGPMRTSLSVACEEEKEGVNPLRLGRPAARVERACPFYPGRSRARQCVPRHDELSGLNEDGTDAVEALNFFEAGEIL
jgi:hypothetical protein